MQSKPSLTDGAIAPTLLKFALPVLFGNVLQSLNGSVNAIWIGRYLGEAALTAASNVNMLLFLLLGAVFGVLMATTILVAQQVGAKNLHEAKRITATSATFFMALTLSTSVLGFVFSHALLAWMHTPADALPFAAAYLRIIFVAMPWMYGFFFIMAVLRGSGDSRTPFLYLSLAVALDIALNPLFIFGWGPVPRLGIEGSAVATLIAQSVSLSALIVHLYRKKHFLCIHADELELFKVDWHVVRILLAKGLPMGLQMLVVSSSMLTMITFVNRYGSQTTAAFAAAMQLWGYIQMPALALGASVSSMTAQNIGAGHWHRVGSITRAGVQFNFLIAGSLIALVYLLNRPALSLFLPPGAEALAIAAHVNFTVIWSFLLFGITMVLFGTVRATGATIPPLILLFISLWLVRVPFAVWLQPVMHEEAIWWSFPLSSTLSVLLAIGYYRWGGWRNARMDVGAKTPIAPLAAPDAPETPASPVGEGAAILTQPTERIRP